MYYFEEFEKIYEKAFLYKRKYLKESMEKDARFELDRLGGSFVSDKEYREQILPYWAKYNEKPEKLWFDYFGSRDSDVNPAFVPADIYINKIVPYINDLRLRYAYSDKCILDRLFPDVKQPVTVCKCMSGIYYDSDMNMVGEDKAVQLCLNHNEMIIIKPADYSSTSSRGITVMNPAESTPEKVKEIFKKTGRTFIVQEMVKQHPELASLNSDAVATIRVNSLLTENGVYIPYSILRIGAPGEKVVTDGKGNWCCEIKDDNTLHEKMLVMDIGGKVDENGDTVSEVLDAVWAGNTAEAKYPKGFAVPFMDRIRSIVRSIHPRLPYFRWLGWDFAVDDKNEPVLFEFNEVPGYYTGQLPVCKPFFGDMTGEILDDYYIHRKLEKNHIQNRIID